MSDQIIKLKAPGTVDQFQIEEQCDPEPGRGEVRIRHHAIGVNFVDVYQRRGLYALPSYPAVLGAEAAGMVEAVGEDVADFRTGDRVAYAGPPIGTYCSTRNVLVERVIRVPDTVSLKTAASSLLRGMTAHMLLEKMHPVHDGSVVMIHAAAGGLGAILVRWAKSLNATVIGCVSTPEKAEIAAGYGADHLIVGRQADIVAEAKRLTGGLGVDVVYDGVGGNTLLQSLRSVRPFGTAVTIGQVAGPIPPVPVEELRPGKSLSHPSIMAWCLDVGRYRESAEMAVRAMERGMVSEIIAEYGLAQVAKAHEELESGRLAGSLLLLP